MKSTLTLLAFVLFSSLSFSQTTIPTLVNPIVVYDSLGAALTYYSSNHAVNTINGQYAVIYNLYYSGSGYNDDAFYVMQLDSNSNVLSQQEYHGLHGGNDIGTNIFSLGNSVYVSSGTLDSTGMNSTLSNVMRIRASSPYDTIWTASMSIGGGGVSQSATCVTADAAGGVYLGSTVQLGTGNFALFITKLDSNGHYVWQAHYDSLGNNIIPTGMAFLGTQLDVTGFMYDSFGNSSIILLHYDKNNGALESAPKFTTRSTGIVYTPAGILTLGSYIVVTGTETVPGGGTIILTQAFDSTLSLAWTDTFSNGPLTTAAAVAPTPGAGAIYIAGTSTDSNGISSMVGTIYGYDGTFYGSVVIPSPFPNQSAGAVGITLDPSNNVYITGWTTTASGDTNILTIAISGSTGATLWEKTYSRNTRGSTGISDVPYSIILIGSSYDPLVTTRSVGPSNTLFQMLEYEQWIPTPCGDTICPTVTYNFKNSQVTTSGTDTFVEFDIYASQNEPTLGYGGGDIILSYNAGAFGNDVVSNNDITVTRGAVTMDSNAYSLSLRDTLFQSSVVPTGGGEVWISVSPINSDSVYYVADTPQQLVHVKMKRQHAGWYKISFDQFDMEGLSEYLSYDYFPYSFVNVGSPLRASADSLYLSIANATISGAPLPTYLDFDIVGYTDNDQPLYKYSIVTSYDVSAFDSAYFTNSLGVGDDGSNPGGTGSGSNGGYPIYSFSHHFTGGSITIEMSPTGSFDGTNSQTGMESFDYLGLPVTIAHVTLHISDCDNLPGIAIDPSSTAEYADVSQPQAGIAFAVDTISAIYNNGDIHMCTLPPHVNYISSDCIGAGTFDTLYIYGSHFGTAQGTVWFNSADTVRKFIPAYRSDILLWTPAEIDMYVPSAPSTAGSGVFYIQNASGLDNSADSNKINIGYANENYRNPVDSSAQFIFRQDTTFVFQLDSALFNTPGVIATVQHVMADINCQTGANLQLDTTGPSSATLPIADWINLISIQPQAIYQPFINNSGAAAYTQILNNMTSCSNGLPKYNNFSRVLREVDISFRDTLPSHLTWNWNDANTATYSQDDFAAFLAHELGHAMLLEHRNPQIAGNVMYYALSNGPNNSRNYDSDPNDILGVYHGLSTGAILGAACSIGYAIQTLGTGCTQTSPACTPYYPTLGIGDVSGSTTFNAYLYPNPYEQGTVIHIEVSVYTAFTIRMYDMLGRIVYSRDISSGEPFDVPLSDFSQSAGMYLIQIADPHTGVVLKMIKL